MTAVQQAQQNVESIYKEGVENCRRGKPDRLFSSSYPGSVSHRYAAAYETWMVLRARSGDRFARTLGYK